MTERDRQRARARALRSFLTFLFERNQPLAICRPDRTLSAISALEAAFAKQGSAVLFGSRCRRLISAWQIFARRRLRVVQRDFESGAAGAQCVEANSSIRRLIRFGCLFVCRPAAVDCNFPPIPAETFDCTKVRERIANICMCARARQSSLLSSSFFCFRDYRSILAKCVVSFSAPLLVV